MPKPTIDGHEALPRTIDRPAPADPAPSLGTGIPTDAPEPFAAPGDDAGRPAPLSAAERRRVLEEWNRTEAEYPGGSCVHRLFEARVERDPHVPAVVFDGGALTYAELNARANRLARHLRSLGVVPGERVALVLARSPELVEAELAVLKCGGAYVPLDPDHPGERLREMLDDSAPAVVLTTGERAERFAGVAAPVVALDAGAPAWASLPATNPDVEGVTAEHLAYVMYTSGSTGRPKGVMVAHRAIVRLVVNNGYAELGPDDRVAFAANPAFDASTLEVWAPLVNGGATVVVSQEAVLDPARLAAALRTHEVSVLWLTVGLFNQYADALRDEWRRLRCLIVGGDALDPRVIARVLRRGPPARLLNGYGPTETTTFALTHEIRRVDAGARGVPLGRPISNTRVYVLDEALEPVPVGVAGEILIGGAGVARGYLDRPELTAERFVADPFGREPGARLYRTGDLGRWLADGTIEFLGRADFQVKVRGFRIEPGEIEARLAEHPGVREAVVLAREDAPGEKRLAAYVVGDETAGAEALRAHLAARLPEYMVPAAYVRLERLPLTPNGKVDRKALPAPDGAAYARAGGEAPVGPTEEALAGIWAEVLGVERVGRRDRFLDLGGHSLLAVRVVSRVREALGVEASPGDLFRSPALADFARAVEAAERADAAAIPPADRSAPIPLSFAQQRLWFLEQLGGTGAAYHIPMRLRLRGELDRGALARALDRIVARHEALRTTFPAVDGEPVQRIAPVEESAFRLVEHDLRARPDAEDELRRLMLDEAAAPFDLARGPLVRGRLVRVAADDHALLLTLHHVVGDGWSTGVLARELGALYGAFARGGADPLPPLPVQYADYAAWHRRWVGGAVLEAQAEYWTRALAGAPELLELPADRPRPPRQSFAGAAVEVELDEALAARLKALGRRHGATLHMTLLAGWAAVLARLSGRDDVVIGTPSANRGRVEVEGLIGFFVNTLALRVDLSGAPTAAGLLERVKARALEAQRNQDIPFEQVVERLRPARTLAHTPLFQAMLSWQNAPGGPPELPGLRPVPVPEPERETAKFDLTLTLAEGGGRIAGTLGYATALFDRATVERFAGYLRRALEGMAADEARPVERLALMPEGERSRVVEGWNRTEAEYPRGACVHELFQAQAARTPDAAAVVFEGGRLTYAELNRRANRLAHHLVRRGVGPDVAVGLCVERGPGMIVALLAVLKAGGAYVPLDPEYPEDRLRHMLADSAPAVLLTEAALAGRLAGADAPLVRVDADAHRWAGEPETDPARGALTPDHLAYVIYTSGSTGRPKGVMNPHRTLVNRVAWGRRAWGIGAGEAVLCKTSLGFDGSVREIFLPLSAGARVVLARPGGHRDPSYLLEVIGREGVTTVNLVPSLLQVLLEAREGDGLRALRRVLCGGEALPGALLERFRARLPGVELHNLYGPSEAATAVASPPCAVEPGRATVPIGGPSANARAFVLDAAGGPVPVGVAGELYIGGVPVARGYLGRPALTAERFVPDALGGDSGARLYRTGDLVRWLGDGRLDFVGRTDFQVKVRGFRVEPGEIAARLREHAGVREAVVTAREDAPGGVRLVAYVVGRADAEALRAHLAARLPSYMVPAAYVRLDALPLLPSGKLDRRALPAPEADAFAARGYQPPRGGRERAVAEIWAELLGAERVGRDDHFFELGGHSLLAVRVAWRVREALGVGASPGDLFERPVLADFASALTAAAPAGAEAIAPVDRGAPIPLSFAQQRLWFVEQLGGTGAAYHIPLRHRLRGPLDRGALARALDRVVARHEALRTTFPAVDGEPVQRIAPVEESAFRLVEHDLRARPDAEVELRRIADDEAAAPFDLAAGPLVRGRLVRVAEDDHALLVTLHHVVGDGWSAGVLVRELGALYDAFRGGRDDPLPPPTTQYADYAAWQRRRMKGELLERQAAYWREALSGAPELLELPLDRPRPRTQDFAGGWAPLELDAELSAALKALSRRHGTTLFMTLLAGWAAVLGRLSGQDDVVIGTPTASRGHREVEGLIGFFLNTLALRVDLSGAPTVAGLLGRVRARALEAQEHQDLPFEQVVEWFDPVRSRAHTPLFQAMLTWQNAPRERLEMAGLRVTREAVTSNGGAKLDLALELAETEGRIAGGATYATALFDAETVERWLGYLQRVLEGMAADDAQPVARLPLMSADERALVVEEWNRTEAEYPAGSCIHELFEAQAARTPHAPAVVFAGGELSYGELNARANRLAHHLRALGVGPGARVGICVERSPEMVVGVLGVLKAGGVFVPLDPSYPRERLEYMLADSAPAAVLARASAARGLAEVFAALGGAPVLELDAAEPAWADRPATNPDRGGLTPNHPAYVTYTSGSTGRPKGVPAVHHRVLNLVHWYGRELGITERDAILLVMSFSFDGTYRNLFAPLFAGGQLHLASDPFDPGKVVAQIAAHGIRAVNLTPTAFQALAEADREDALARMRTVVLVGEAVQPRTLMRLPEPRPELVNLYGPTECSGIVTYHRLSRDLAGYLERPVPAGRPIPNGRIYILDPDGNPVPVGVAGEIHIGGTPVGPGYQGRPEQTAERFVADPFSPRPGARMYRTGDLARWLADGTIELLGRTDHQVKVRGYRVELGEIEARLRAHPAVRQAAVVAREDAPGEKRLVAYVVGDAAAEALRAHLAAALPAYMVPAAYVRLEALPLTTSGKLDRRALPAPDAAAYARRGDERPRGQTEEALADVWAEVLGVERVGRRDHFFDLGGHSLLAVRLVARVREALSPAMTLDDLFAYPTLDALAARLDGKVEWLGADHAVPVRETGAQRPLFVVHDMTGLVAYAQLLRPCLDAEIPVYALPGPLKSTAEVDSMDDLVDRLVRMMVEVRPEGPYRLAGWSAGGVFAYAVAQRLVETGRAVEFVGMMDTSHPTRRVQRVAPRARMFAVLELLARDSSAPAPTPESLLALREATEGQELPAFIATCHARGLLPRSVTVERAQQVWNRIALLRRTTWEFVPRPLPVPVHLFSASGEARDDPRRGWREMPGGAPILLEHVPGTHLTMFRKGNVEALGAALSRALRASSGG